MQNTKKYLDEEGLSVLAENLKRYISIKTGRNSNSRPGNNNGSGNDNNSSLISSDGDGNIQIGQSSYVQDGGLLALGKDMVAGGIASIAIGDYGGAMGGCDIAIGDECTTYGWGDVAVGSGSYTCRKENSTQNTVLGVGACTYNRNGVENAVAIGAYSVAENDLEFSIGNEDMQRRITNVTDGVNDTDACTVGQLNAAVAALRAELGLS